MKIGDMVYVSLSGYHGVYIVSGKIGEKYKLCRKDIPNFVLIVAKDKIFNSN